MERLLMRLRDETLSQAAKAELARLTVTALYAGGETALLEQILAIGRKYESEVDKEEVRALNVALNAEIERRKGYK